MSTFDRLIKYLPFSYNPQQGRPLYALLQTIANMDDDLLNQIENAVQEVGLNGAVNSMLDFYARRVGLSRFPNESDSSLLQRIIAQFSRRLDPVSITNYFKLYNQQVYGVYENNGNSVVIGANFNNFNYTRVPITGTLTRSTVAYDYNGNQININTPAFILTTKGQAAFVWQGTTNVLTANQSSAETDLTGFTSVNGAVLAQDSSYAWHGKYSVKVSTPGSVAGEGVKISFTGNPNTVYTGSLYIRGNGTIQVQLINGSIYGTVQTITLINNSQWQRLDNFSMFCNGGNVDLIISTTTPQQAIFWIDGIQVEAGIYSTPWMIGGSTRAGETLTFPTAGILNPLQGCIRIALLQHQATYDKHSYRYVFSHSTGNNQNVIAIRHTPDNFWQLWLSDNAGNSTYLNVPDKDVQPFPNGSMYGYMPNLILFGVNYSGSKAEFWINGVLMVSADLPTVPSVAASNIYIGSWIDGTGHINGEVFKIELSPKSRQKEYLQTYDSIVDDTLLMDGMSWFKAGFISNNLTGYIPSNYEGSAFHLSIMGASQAGYGSYYDQSYYDNMYFMTSLNQGIQQYINNNVLKQCKAAGIVPLFE
jgi:hypothetical protein